MRNKQVRKMIIVTAITMMTTNVAPLVAIAAEDTNTGENPSVEESKGSTTELVTKTDSESSSMKVTETKNDDGSTTKEYEYKEEVAADNLSEALDKYEEKVNEQESIKSEIESAGGSYEYKVEIVDESTKEDVTERVDTKTEAEKLAQETNGTITEVEGTTTKGESASQDGFTSEEAANQWAEEKAEELVNNQTTDNSEKVTTDTTISLVDGTGITVSEKKDIKEKIFETEEEAIEYATSFNEADYTITPVNGKWVYQKKEVTATDKDGEILYFDTEEAADEYIAENSAEGAYLDKVEIIDSVTQEVTETVVITATSYEEFVAKVEALYAEAAQNENVTIVEDKADVLENYETSINFEELTEEQKKELMEQMQEDAKDQNYTYMHLDLQTAAKLNVYDDEGNSSEVDCSIKNDDTLKVYVFAEVDGKMQEIVMNATIEKDPQGYWEIRSNNKKLNLKKCFVMIKGTLVYQVDGETKESEFSTTGYLNNNYNTCSDKPSSSNWPSWPSFGYPNYGQSGNKSGGYDIVLDNFTLDSEGKVTVESSATKVYTISVTKTTTKYVVKYETDDLTTGVYEQDYKVEGTYVEKTDIPAEYMAEITSQLTNILYDVDYQKTNESFKVVIDGEGKVTVVPVDEPDDSKPEKDKEHNKNNDDDDDDEKKSTTPTVAAAEEQPIVIGYIPVAPVQPEVVPVSTQTPSTETAVEVPRTSDGYDLVETGAKVTGIAALFAIIGALIPFKRRKNKEA